MRARATNTDASFVTRIATMVSSGLQMWANGYAPNIERRLSDAIGTMETSNEILDGEASSTRKNG